MALELALTPIVGANKATERPTGVIMIQTPLKMGNWEGNDAANKVICKLINTLVMHL